MNLENKTSEEFFGTAENVDINVKELIQKEVSGNKEDKAKELYSENPNIIADNEGQNLKKDSLEEYANLVKDFRNCLLDMKKDLGIGSISLKKFTGDKIKLVFERSDRVGVKTPSKKTAIALAKEGNSIRNYTQLVERGTKYRKPKYHYYIPFRDVKKEHIEVFYKYVINRFRKK